MDGTSSGRDLRRFHYKQVPPASYGLDVLDVLGFDQKDLNRVVGMKKLAPYREDGGMARPNYAKLRELKQQHRVQTAVRQGRAKRRELAAYAGPTVLAAADGTSHKSAQASAAAASKHIADDDEELRQRRLESYAPLTLRRADQGQAQGMYRTKHRTAAGAGGVPGVETSAAAIKVTRAQKKNMRRSEKRRMQRSASD